MFAKLKTIPGPYMKNISGKHCMNVIHRMLYFSCKINEVDYTIKILPLINFYFSYFVL